MTLPAFRPANPLLEDEYDNMLACIRCGLCLTSCPTYVLSLQESESPRGRVGMARALAEGQLAATPDLVEHELNCLVCDACSAVCPAGVHMDPLQVRLRSALTARAAPHDWQTRFVRWLVFNWLFMSLARLRLLARVLWLYQHSGAQWLVHRLGILRLLGLRESEALLPSVSGSPLVPRGETYAATTPDGTARPVAFFAGCIMSTALADIDRATLRVLQRGGCRVRNPAAQGCCGALHAHSGDLTRTKVLARANIVAFEHVDGPIVVNSAGCGAMLKDYAHHFRHDPNWAERARAFSARVRDLSQVLVDAPLPTREIAAKSIVYQDACHLLHAQRVSKPPRDLLKRIPGLKLSEIAEAGLCCGSAGVYNVTNPVQSRQLRDRKLDNALAAAPELIVTENPGCLLQLRAGLAERGSRVEVKHLAEVLDEASRP